MAHRYPRFRGVAFAGDGTLGVGAGGVERVRQTLPDRRGDTDEIVEKINNAGKFNTGFTTVEFLAAALLDMEFHMLTDTATLDIREFEKAAMDKYGLIPEITPRYRSTYFNHIWASGYAAGYYSYYWSEMLDADAFKAFKETGDIFNKEVASRFESEILSKGGTRDPREMYINFRGTEPTIDALLENRGLK